MFFLFHENSYIGFMKWRNSWTHSRVSVKLDTAQCSHIDTPHENEKKYVSLVKLKNRCRRIHVSMTSLNCTHSKISRKCHEKTYIHLLAREWVMLEHAVVPRRLSWVSSRHVFFRPGAPRIERYPCSAGGRGLKHEWSFTSKRTSYVEIIVVTSTSLTSKVKSKTERKMQR